MPLSAGTKLGPYEILAPIGKGGMGEVYKARDTRLDRLVAIKVSKAEFSERFEREARVVAALNHPNICHLYDVGPNYLVMEYVEGVPLKGPLPLDRAFPLAIQIADALDAAHAKGVVHRDLKPANVLIARDDRAKILDFGLALMKTLAERPEDATLTMGITDPGTTVGTVAYMSPEQARGQTLDLRTDLWSFGVMLYEMVTGARPFDGATTALTFEAILNRAPVAAHERNSKVTAELERIIGRLLEKDRETRYQSAADVRADLKRVERDSSVTVPIAVAAPKPAGRWRYGIAAAVVLLVAAGGFFLWQRTHAAPLSDKDVLVLADFTNTTGDPVFDGTLREALAVGLEESPFLKIMDDAQVRQTLQLMGHSPKDRITNDIAHEICVRAGEKAMIGGSIASLGKTYAITLQATNCQSGATLAREQVEAQDKERVLKAVGTAATAMRGKLGESLSSVKSSDPLGETRELTTTSLDAFQAFAQGIERVRQGSSAEGLPFFQRARELDPNFAVAHLVEAIMYGNLGQDQRRDEGVKKAFALIDRVSERERLEISAYYYEYVTGETGKAVEIAEQEAREYPRVFVPHNTLGIMYRRMAEPEKGLRENQEALRLAPGDSILYGNVMYDFAESGRFDEAKAVAEQAYARKLDAMPIHDVLLEIAFAQGDVVAAQKEIQWMTGKPEEFQSLLGQASNAMSLGQFRKANSLFQQAIDLMQHRGLKSPVQIEQIKAEEQADLDNCGPIRALARLPSPPAGDPQQAVMAAVDPAMCGVTAPAEKLADETAKQRPMDTLMNELYLPILRAAIELGRNQPEKAVEFLTPTAKYERGSAGLMVVFLRGRAYLKAKKGPEAEAEFQKLLDRKGVNARFSYAGSYLYLARAAMLAGDTGKAKKAYQDFLAFWKDADPDIPTLIEAKAENDKLR